MNTGWQAHRCQWRRHGWARVDMTKLSGGVLEDLTSRCPSDLVVCVHQAGFTSPFIRIISGLRRVQSAHRSQMLRTWALYEERRFSCYREPDTEDTWAEATSWRSRSNQVPRGCCGLDAAWACSHGMNRRMASCMAFRPHTLMGTCRNA